MLDSQSKDAGANPATTTFGMRCKHCEVGIPLAQSNFELENKIEEGFKKK